MANKKKAAKKATIKAFAGGRWRTVTPEQAFALRVASLVAPAVAKAVAKAVTRREVSLSIGLKSNDETGSGGAYWEAYTNDDGQENNGKNYSNTNDAMTACDNWRNSRSDGSDWQCVTSTGKNPHTGGGVHKRRIPTMQ